MKSIFLQYIYSNLQFVTHVPYQFCKYIILARKCRDKLAELKSNNTYIQEADKKMKMKFTL